MQEVSQKSGSANIGVIAVVAVVALAGIAGAVIFRSERASSIEASAPAVPVKGTSFDEAPKAAPELATAAPPAASAPEATPAATPLTLTATQPKPATAADVPADISKIPSATPVAPVQVASVAGGSPPPAQPAPADNANAGDFKELTWQVLAGFKYVEPVPREGAKPEEIEAERKKNQIPADVLALNGTSTVVEGWMVPMQVDDNGGVKSFVLVKTQPQCCFGDTQKMNEWIDVSMPTGKTAEFNVDRPIKVYGALEVGEKVEDGFVLSVYRMKAAKVSG